MRSGFLITPQGETALELFETDPPIRYAAELDDGRGFIAYDVETLADVYELGMHGTIYAEIPPEQQGDADEFLKRLSRGPKRQSATGDERFILYPTPGDLSATAALGYFVQLFEPRAACLVATTPHEFYILVEDGPEWSCRIKSVWDCSVVAWRDVRVEAAV